MMQNEKMVLLSLSPSWFPRDRSSIVSSIVTAAAAEAPYAAYRVNEALSNEFFSLSLLILISNYSLPTGRFENFRDFAGGKIAPSSKLDTLHTRERNFFFFFFESLGVTKK